MEVLYPYCAGLDVHKNSVVACARHMSGGKISTKVRTFKTTTEELLVLLAWLTDQGVTHIAMEATGVYWKPVWHILSDDDFVMVLANAAHVKNVPGRKTDVNDAQWLADLMAHGLIRASFVPDQLTQQIRDLLRTRKQLVRERASHTLRIQKVLEDANIKLDSVVTDLLGLSGRRILDALVKGQTTPAVLAALADGRIHATAEELTAALYGRVTSHHRFLVKLHLDQIDAIAQAIASIDEEVDSQAEPFRQPAQMVSAIPGLGPLAALVVLAEIGLDMSHFPSAAHLISWAGLCPRNDESAGKRRSTRMRNGAPWLKTVLIQCAWAAAAHQRKLLPVALSPPPIAAWRKESYRRSGSLSTHHHLSHAEERNPLRGSRSKLLRSEGQRETGDALDQSPASLGIPGAHRTKDRLSTGTFLIRGVQRGYFSFQRKRSEIMKVDELPISDKELPWWKPISGADHGSMSDLAIYHHSRNVPEIGCVATFRYAGWRRERIAK